MIDRSPHADGTSPRPFELSGFPRALRPISEALADSGRTAFWVGPGLLQLIEGGVPASFALTTDASEKTLTTLFRRAVPVADRRGTVMIPSPAGPIDVTPYQCGRDIQDELAHLDFTIHAMAFDARNSELLDPFEGLADWKAGRLRAVGCAADRLAEDPLRRLRAVRLSAAHGLKPDSELLAALVGVGSRMDRIARIRVREELVATIIAPGVGQAWSLMAQIGLSDQLAGGASARAGAWIEQLPCDLELRLAAWLCGTRSRRVLQRLRFSRQIADRVEHLLQLHPIETQVDPARLPAVARLARRESARDLSDLIDLRRAELRLPGPKTADASTRLDALEGVLTELRAQRVNEPHARLAIGGSEIMQELACGPGPQIGHALAYLSAQIGNDPDLNEPERLRSLLRDWTEDRSAAESEN